MKRNLPSRAIQLGFVLLIVMTLAMPVSAATTTTRDRQGCAWYDVACWARLLTGGGSTNPTPVPTQAPVVNTPAFQATWTPQPQSTAAPKATSVLPTLTPVPPQDSLLKQIELIDADKKFTLADANKTVLELPATMAEKVNLTGWVALATKMSDKNWEIKGIPGQRFRITGGDVSMALSWTCYDAHDVENTRDNIIRYAGDCSSYYGLVLQSWQLSPHPNPWPSGWEFQLTAAMFRRAQTPSSDAFLAGVGVGDWHYQYPFEAAKFVRDNTLFNYELDAPHKNADGFWVGENWIRKGQTYSFVVPSSGEPVPYTYFAYASRAKGDYSKRTDAWAMKGNLEAGTTMTGFVVCGIYMSSHSSTCDPFLVVEDSSFTPWGAKFVSVEDLLGGNTVPTEYRK